MGRKVSFWLDVVGGLKFFVVCLVVALLSAVPFGLVAVFSELSVVLGVLLLVCLLPFLVWGYGFFARKMWGWK